MSDVKKIEEERLWKELESFTMHGDSVPDHTRGGIVRYIVDGTEPGGFLYGVIICDLRKVMWHADLPNMKALHATYAFFYNVAPSDCWGNAEAVEKWIEKGGIGGK